MLQKLKSKLDLHTLEVLILSSKSLVVKVFAVIFSVLISLFLGNTIGAKGIGIINLANQVIALILVFSLLGVGQIVIKRVAIAFENQNWKKISNVVYNTFLINGGITFLFTIILILSSGWISEVVFKQPDLKIPLIISSIVLLPQIFSRIFASFLVGYKKVWQSQLVDQALSVFLVAIGLLVLWLMKIEITINKVALLYALSLIITTVTIGTYWLKLSKINFSNTFLDKGLFKESFPLLIVNSSLLLSQNIDIIMLGLLSDIKSVGLYAVASRLALLTSFILQISTATLANKISVLYGNDKIKELEKMLQQISKYLGIIGLFILVFFIFLGKIILSFWGVDFIPAYSILIILSVGQFFNIASGPVTNILALTNHGKALRNITIGTIALNIILNYFFIINFDANGAAMATSITTILNMAICFYYIRNKLNIRILNF